MTCLVAEQVLAWQADRMIVLQHIVCVSRSREEQKLQVPAHTGMLERRILVSTGLARLFGWSNDMGTHRDHFDPFVTGGRSVAMRSQRRFRMTLQPALMQGGVPECGQAPDEDLHALTWKGRVRWGLRTEVM